jgi:hypothetical protein
MHFETFHVNQQPTYASMYPPGQGLILAVGTVVFGHPWFGVWLSVVLLSLAVCWALQAWLPPPWASTGGVIAATLASFSYWMTGYWGGGLAGIGGALVIGAWPRLERKPGARNAIVFACGVVILACTRMYEGAVLTAVAGAFLVGAASRRRFSLRKVLLPATLVLAAAGAWLMFYCWRVTGSPTLLPYILNARTYIYRPLLLWEHDRPADPR